MISFVKKPNLPSGTVKTVICGTKDESILAFFENCGINVIKTMPNKFIDASVSEHADMSALHLGNDSIIIDTNQNELYEELEQLGVAVQKTCAEICGDYPEDVKLNFAVIGDTVAGNFKFADKKLSELIAEKKHISVRQGYCKCSVLVVNEKAIITDDESINRKMTENGFDSLLVRKGDVTLPGHEYGFIGGASGKISKNTIVFFGNIKKHRDFKSIDSFLSKHRCNFICTDDGNLRDIGGIIPVIEEII